MGHRRSRPTDRLCKWETERREKRKKWWWYWLAIWWPSVSQGLMVLGGFRGGGRKEKGGGDKRFRIRRIEGRKGSLTHSILFTAEKNRRKVAQTSRVLKKMNTSMPLHLFCLSFIHFLILFSWRERNNPPRQLGKPLRVFPDRHIHETKIRERKNSTSFKRQILTS